MSFSMVFPGQGSQRVGMMEQMLHHSDHVASTFAQANDALGFDLWKLVSEGPPEELNLTANAQPAILAASVALWRTWCERTQARPNLLAGHSLGEYSALVCAQVLAFGDAVKLVNKRGQLMQSAVPQGEGAMAALLGLDDAAAVEVCQTLEHAGVVEAVNFNAPGQVVIAGSKEAVEAACLAAKEAGARRAQILPVSVPAHSSLMKEAAVEFAEVVASVDFAEPTIPLLHNVGIDQVDDIRQAVIRQLYNPVPWTEIVKKIVATHAPSVVIECGPGKVLSGLVRRIDKSVNVASIYDDHLLNDAIQLTS